MKLCFLFIVSVFFSIVVFILGVLMLMLFGYLGMKIVMYVNVWMILEVCKGVGKVFVIVFWLGVVMGFLLVVNGLFVLFLMILVFKLYFGDDWVGLYEVIIGYGLGGFLVVLFGCVGGGIYMKVVDVGVDLVGKVE